jgi:hypothetical protein
VSARAEPRPEQDSLQREWWLRALLILQSPRGVFAALRGDSDEAAQARQEPILAIVYLAGIAGVLATPIAGRILDDVEVDGLLVAVWAFLGGGFYAFAVYWLLGGVLYLALQRLGSQGSYRRARHLLGFAVAPLVLSLLFLWPLRLAFYGGDVFRSGGSDEGAGSTLFRGLEIGLFGWAFALLLVGVRTVHGWTWARSAAGVALTAAVPAVVVLVDALR